MFAHLMSGGSLAILFVKERSMTPEIHCPDFLLIHRCRSSGSTWCSVWLHWTYWLGLELSVAQIVYDCISAMGLLKTILFSQRMSTRTILLHMTPPLKGLQQTEVQAVFKLLAVLRSCRVRFLYCEVPWDGSRPCTCCISWLHCICSIHVLPEKTFYENTFVSDFQHLFFEGNAWSFSLSSSPNLAAVWSHSYRTLVMATYCGSVSPVPSIHRTWCQPDTYFVWQ